MFMNILVVIFVLAIGYTWSVRGVFNAMIHAMCVFFAGAIAFALWEPLAMVLLGANDAPVVEGMAWGVSLIVPFIVMMLVFRVATDKLVKANIRSLKMLDYGGGAGFGLASGVLTAGVMIIGIGYMRLPSTFMGYQPVWYAEDRTGAGSLVEHDKLWIPVDSITAAVYQNLSDGSMSSKESLKKWYPNLTLTGFASRINPGDGAGRNAITDDAFKILSSYTIGNTNGSTDRDQTIEDQKFMDIHGEVANTMAGYLAGYVVEFGPKAKEKGGKGGQVVISNGQIRILTRNTKDGSTNTIFPLAAISESSDEDEYGRWKFDGEDIFITSTGGKSRIPMGFEFYVPADEEPLALYVKNIRVPVSSLEDPRAFSTASERKRLIRTGSLLKGDQVKRVFDDSQAVLVDSTTGGRGAPARISNSIGTTISSQLIKQRGMKIDEENHITSGQAKFDSVEEMGRGKGPSGKALKVDKFKLGKKQLMVQIKVGSASPGGLMSEAAKLAPADQPFMLIDTNGNEYEAVGFVYQDPSKDLYQIRYTPGGTLSGLNESGLPRISRSKADQKFTLLFLVSSKTQIKYFTIGDTVLMRFDPMLGRD